MSDNSKKRHELKKQLDSKAQIANLDNIQNAINYLTSPKKFNLVEGATTIPTGKQIETQRFIICFDYLNWNTCEFEQFKPANGKKLLSILEQVAKCQINKFPELKLGRDSVSRGGPYESLFAKVTPDVSHLEETEFCDGRFFYFITEPHFNVVSIESKHRNIDN